MKNPMDMSGKHIIVTGASAGIGCAAAILLSQLGAKVSLVARSAERMQSTLLKMEGTAHQCFAVDLANLDGLEPMCKDIVEKSGMIDGFVHCAGIGKNRPIAISKPDFVDETMRLNFYAFLEMARVLSKKKYSCDGASLLAVSSVAALRGDRTQGAYAASKAALCGVIHPMAKEMAVRNIRVNAVAFGMIQTEMYEKFQAAGGNEESLKSQYLGVGSCEDAANAICFLLSDASKFITGTTLVADGGYLS